MKYYFLFEKVFDVFTISWKAYFLSMVLPDTPRDRREWFLPVRLPLRKLRDTVHTHLKIMMILTMGAMIWKSTIFVLLRCRNRPDHSHPHDWLHDWHLELTHDRPRYPHILVKLTVTMTDPIKNLMTAWLTKLCWGSLAHVFKSMCSSFKLIK